MRQRVSSIAPLKRPPHDSHRIESRSEGRSLLASHRGQIRESGLDETDEPLISCPFSLATSYSENYAPRSSASGFLQEIPNRSDWRGSRPAFACSTRCRTCASASLS